MTEIVKTASMAIALALTLAAAAPVRAQVITPQAQTPVATAQPAASQLSSTTPITQSSLPNSPKYKYEPRAHVPSSAMRSFQAGNGIARSRQ